MKQLFIFSLLAFVLSPLAAQYYSPVLADSIFEFKDRRDGERYSVVQLGDMYWLGENLRYKTKDSWCYKNKDYGCSEFGRLYDWDDALTACPDGWRLPTKEEWERLIEQLGGEKKAGYALVYDRGLGINAQFGYPPNLNGRFGVEESQTNFWTATSLNDDTAWTYYMIKNKLPLVLYGYMSKKYNLSCRCVTESIPN